MIKNPKIFKNLWSLEDSLDLISSFCSSATAGKHGVCIINNVHYLLHISQLKWEHHGDKSFISTYKRIRVPISLYAVASGLFPGSLETSSPKTQMFCFFLFSFGFQGWSVCVSWRRVWGLTVDEFVGGAVAIWRQTSSQRWFISTSFLFSCEGCSNLWPPVSLLPPLPVSVCLSPPALQRPVTFFNIPA